MGLTLSQSAEYANADTLSQGVVDTFVYADPLLERMKFETYASNAYAYDQELTLPDGDWYGINEDWDSKNPTVEKQYAIMKMIGGAIDIDDFQISIHSSTNDLKQQQLEKRIKGIKKTFNETLYYGNRTTNPKEPDGLHVLINNTTYNTILADRSDTGTVALSMSDHLDQALEMVKGYTSSLIVTSKRLRRGILKYLRSVSGIQSSRDDFGHMRTIWGDGNIPIVSSDHLSAAELTSSGAFSARTGGATSSIFVLTFEPGGLEGLHVRPMETLPYKEHGNGNSVRARVRWYVTWKIESLISCVKIVGIDSDGTVVA